MIKTNTQLRRKTILLTSLFVLVLLLVGCDRTTTPTPPPLVPTHTPVVATPAAPTLMPTVSPPPTATTATGPEVTPVQIASPSPVATVAPAPETSPTPQSEAPGFNQDLLFGPFHLPEAEYSNSPFTGSFAALRPDTATATLEAARKAGIRLIINLAGGRPGYQESDGAFSVSRFKERLDAYKSVDLASYVADGTILGHLMFDEPQDPSNWNGKPAPFADIEAAAAYSKELWPTLPVGVGGPASFLQGGAPWSALDFAFAQYTTQRGDVMTWLREEVAAARQAQLGLVLSINILGGNNRSPVTAAQLKEWGDLFASEPSVCGLLMWKYDPGYVQDASVAAAFAEISQIARARTVRSCLP